MKKKLNLGQTIVIVEISRFEIKIFSFYLMLIDLLYILY